jgi:2'-5' RNA ligase
VSEPARLFVAVQPSTDAVVHLNDAVAPLRPHWPGLRWTAPAMWHLTCAFFGDMDTQRLPELEARLSRAAARHRRSTLRFAGAGAFARPARASIVYAGIGLVPPASLAGSELAGLSASCAAVGRRLGLSIEDRAFRPHLTLGRVKGRAPMDLRPLVAELSGYEGPSWSASAIVLVRSYLGSEPRHEALASSPLLGDEP